MNRFRSFLFPILMAALVAIASLVGIFLSGCGKKSAEKTAEIKVETDDGSVALYPGSGMGFYGGKSGNGGPQETWVGPALDGGGVLFVTRGLYRFDITEWTEGDITFHLHCLGKEGSPSTLEIYVVDDFGSLPDTLVGPQDVSEIWDLPETGKNIGQATPSSDDWLETSISASVVQEKKTPEGYLAIMLKVSNEDINETNFYQMSNYESAVARNEDKPYLEWSE